MRNVSLTLEKDNSKMHPVDNGQQIERVQCRIKERNITRVTGPYSFIASDIAVNSTHINFGNTSFI